MEMEILGRKNPESSSLRHYFNCVCFRFRWRDKLSFPMLVMDETTGERNVLYFYDMEAEDVPDVSPIQKFTLF